MTNSQRKFALALAKKLLPDDEFQKVFSIDVQDNGFGFDNFGLEKEAAILAFAFVRYLYKYYFRVQSQGIDNVPLTGRGIIAANHSGVLPIDGVMIGADLASGMSKPRIMRAMVDNFMGFLPFVNVMFARIGQVVGARRNFSALLEQEELIAAFPEGTKGLGKPFSQRYQLARFNVGFIKLSLKFKAPIIPTAVVGAEEQAPMLFDLKPIARMLDFPYFPVTPFFPLLGPLGALPLPVRYYISYGKPLRFFEEYPPETINEPEKILMLADRVQITVQDMLIQGLDARPSIF